MKFQMVLGVIAASMVLSGCQKSVDVSLDYASTSVGTVNGGKYQVGKVFRWIPQERILVDLAKVDPATSVLTPTPPTKDVARSVRGFVAGANFDISAAQAAEVEAMATRGTSVAYHDYSIAESNDTRGAMSSYINSEPEAVAIDWALKEAVASFKDAAVPDVYFVTVFKTVTTSKTELGAGSEISGSINLPIQGIGATNIKYSDTDVLLCEGRQTCFFDVRIYEPYINSAGNFDFRTTSRVGKRQFFGDLRDATF